MQLKSIFKTALLLRTGFAVEQHLRRSGFDEIGRRTNAVALTTPDSNKVIRISEDGQGSEEFFTLAKNMAGNAYLPVVYGHKILPSGDHVACVEKLVSLSSKQVYIRYKSIYEAGKRGEEINDLNRDWRNKIDQATEIMKQINMTFMTPDYISDNSRLPCIRDYHAAGIALFELSQKINKVDGRYIPGPDLNPTNILFREQQDGSFFPVLYDTIIKQHYGKREVDNINSARAKFFMEPL